MSQFLTDYEPDEITEDGQVTDFADWSERVLDWCFELGGDTLVKRVTQEDLDENYDDANSQRVALILKEKYSL